MSSSHEKTLPPPHLDGLSIRYITNEMRKIEDLTSLARQAQDYINLIIKSTEDLDVINEYVSAIIGQLDQYAESEGLIGQESELQGPRVFLPIETIDSNGHMTHRVEEIKVDNPSDPTKHASARGRFYGFHMLSTYGLSEAQGSAVAIAPRGSVRIVYQVVVGSLNSPHINGKRIAYSHVDESQVSFVKDEKDMSRDFAEHKLRSALSYQEIEGLALTVRISELEAYASGKERYRSGHVKQVGFELANIVESAQGILTTRAKDALTDLVKIHLASGNKVFRIESSYCLEEDPTSSDYSAGELNIMVKNPNDQAVVMDAELLDVVFKKIAVEGVKPCLALEIDWRDGEEIKSKTIYIPMDQVSEFTPLQ